MTVSLLDVQARWGYSEILEGTQSQNYGNGDDINALRTKRGQGIDFIELTVKERYTLAFRCACVRPNLFAYFVGIETFEVVQLSRFRLGHLVVPPNVWRDSNGVFYPFSHYITTQTEEVGDARLLGPPPRGYISFSDPVLVGYSYGHSILIDGYHRAALFWKYGAHDCTLAAYIPQPPAGI